MRWCNRRYVPGLHGIEIKLIDENRNENCNAYYVDEINNHLCGYKTITEKE